MHHADPAVAASDHRDRPALVGAPDVDPGGAQARDDGRGWMAVVVLAHAHQRQFGPYPGEQLGVLVR